ncbi:MAG: hypothetical protein SGBAC_009519 [Bacillariaceae sp.]
MNSLEEHQALMEEGIWKLHLDMGNIDEALELFEKHEVTTAVDLILCASYPLNLKLTHFQALRLVCLITSRRDRVQWHELFVEVYSESPNWQYCVMHVADCFPNLSVSMRHSSNLRLPMSTSYAIHHALQYGNSLQELSLSHCVLSDDTMAILSQAINSPSLAFRRLCFSNVECISSPSGNVVRGYDPHPLEVALVENTTLQCIELRDVMTTNPEVLFSLINALIGHSSLEELSLEGSNLARTVRMQQGESISIAPLRKILMDPQCRISRLDLANCGLGQHPCPERLLLQSLLSALAKNTSVESLDLTENGFDSKDMTMVLDGLKGIPRIRQVDLNDQGNLLTKGSIEWLARSCLLDPQPTIHVEEIQIDDWLPGEGAFDYDSESSDEHDEEKTEIESILLKLLRNNPSLSNLGIELAEVKNRLSPRVAQLLDLNLCGRRGIAPATIQQETCDSTSAAYPYGHIPLALWPVVLQRANRIMSEFPDRRATVLYHFSQNGPFLFNH